MTDPGKKKDGFRSWAPNIDTWPESWMEVEADREYGRQLLPSFKAFLQSLYDQGMARNTWVRYRDGL